MKTSMFNYDLVLVLLAYIIRYTTGSMINDPHTEFLFDNYPDKILFSPNETQMTTKVADKMDCVFSCTSRPWCQSINYKLQSENNDRLHICELLSTSTSNTKPEDWKPAKGFTHLSIRENKCMDPSTCQNNGSCYPDYDNDYRCECNATKGTNCEIFYSNCSELLSAGYTKPGVYHIDPDGSGSFPVFCEGGGWTVVQRNRKNSSISFNHGWQEYKTGFGNLNDEFWLGLDKIYRLTERQVTSLRVDLEDVNGNKKHAVYSSFSIADESDFYRLHVSGYSGTAGDAIATATNQEWINNNMRFSTPDKDNDGYARGNCADKAGWWYRWCTNSDLNGDQTWWTFNKVLNSSKMKLK